jgi:hypothetical protein
MNPFSLVTRPVQDLLQALVAWVGWKIYQRYGQAARERFDAWVQRASPKAAEVVAALRQPA